jgi:hypothetical protein
MFDQVNFLDLHTADNNNIIGRSYRISDPRNASGAKRKLPGERQTIMHGGLRMSVSEVAQLNLSWNNATEESVPRSKESHSRQMGVRFMFSKSTSDNPAY